LNNNRRGFIRKRLVIGLGCAALIAAAIGVYFAFFRNRAPEITDHEPIPPELYVGDAFNITAIVTDDEGVKEVLGIVQEPDGTIREIVLNRTNGSWENTYEVEKEGSHEVSIKAEDIKGKETTQYAGKFEGIPNTPPELIYNGELPESMYVGDEIIIAFNASDKEGNLEVIVTAESQGKSIPVGTNKTGQDSYEAVYKPEEAGIHEIIARVRDFIGKEATQVFGEIEVYLQKILDYEVPRYVEPGDGFNAWAEVEGTCIESVILKIEGFDDIFFKNTKDNLWETTEKIRIFKDGHYKYSVVIINSIEQEIPSEEGTIIVRKSGGGGGDGGCFTADTKVLMADGSFKPIIDIKENEEVQSFDFKTNGLSNNKVTGLFKFDADSYLLINNNLKVTENHPFAVGFDIWQEAAKLEVGDNVLGMKDIKLKSIKEVLEATQVFNLTVDGTHNYFVSDGKEVFLVHNKGGGACLVNDSLVLGGNNEVIKIQDLSVGDSIKSVDLEDNSIVNTKITKIVKDHAREYYYSINNELFITNDHPVCVLRENELKWICVENLRIGDKIKSLSSFIEVRSIERKNSAANTVYLETESGNFVVKAGNNYYVVKSNYSQTLAGGFDTWQEAAKLKVVDEVLGIKEIEIRSIEEVLKATQVFNLTVDGTHNYFVSDGKEVFLVHNKGYR